MISKVNQLYHCVLLVVVHRQNCSNLPLTSSTPSRRPYVDGFEKRTSPYTVSPPPLVAEAL